MISVAIVEDDIVFSNLLSSYLNRYASQHDETFGISVFSNGIDFLTNYQANYEIIFMDIDMPHLNGLETARKLRKLDNSSILIFVTNLARYAIKGYEVDAMDYILKPLNYSAFSLKVQKAVSLCHKNTDTKISLSTRTGNIVFPVSSIYYVESSGHRIDYHTEHGTYSGYGTLKSVEEQLPSDCFYRCNSCYIVNLNYITSCDGFIIQVGKEQLSVSRARKKQFLEALHQYYISRGWR